MSEVTQVTLGKKKIPDLEKIYIKDGMKSI